MITPAFHRTVSAALSIRVLAALAIAFALAAGTHVGIAGAQETDDPRADQAAYTVTFVEQAIERYESNGLGETLAYYNSEESIDGQWYVFIYDARERARSPRRRPRPRGPTLKLRARIQRVSLRRFGSRRRQGKPRGGLARLHLR